MNCLAEHRIAIVIYSANRAYDIKTLDWLDRPDVYLCIPQGQVEEYKNARQPLQAQVLSHPDEIDRLYKKIDWVTEYFRDKADAVVKVDDDIVAVRDNGLYHATDDGITEAATLNSQRFIEVIQNLYLMARDLNTAIFGFGNVNRFYQYASFDRFRFCTAFDASIMGYRIEDKIKVDHSIKVKNEYDLQLQSLYYYRRNLVDKRFRQVKFNMHGQHGGMASGRNTAIIDEAKLVLKNKWGGNIQFGKNSVRFKWNEN